MPINETPDRKRIREAAEADLETFIRLVQPKQVLGNIHTEWCRWATRQDSSSHQLTLLPRDHQKSRLIAYRVAWMITKNPDIRVLYISSTSNLAEKQLKFIKDIITSSVYTRYWPNMVNAQEGQREKWTNSEISVDHPKRREEGVRDPTIFTGGLTTNLVGMHCDICVLDDVVTHETAYTELGRDKVKSQYSLLSSIEGTDSQEWVVGTRYHPKDLYSELLQMKEEVFDEEGEIVDETPIYEIFERQVEDRGDGTGQFLWPRQQRGDGKWFGFDAKILAKKRGQYLDRTQFRAQYYNDPNDPGELRIDRGKFQYYEPKFLNHEGTTWTYRGYRLNVVASVDFSYTATKRSDYTAIVVIGLDAANNVYVLDIDRFKTSKISDYFKHILDLHTKWDFRKLGAEVTSGQKAIVEELKDSYIKPNGLALSVQEIKHSRYEGTKEERISAILEPRYENLQMWHYRGGNCQILEDEIVDDHPAHDDVIDALASAISIGTPPSGGYQQARASNIIYHPKFGGVAFA